MMVRKGGAAGVQSESGLFGDKAHLVGHAAWHKCWANHVSDGRPTAPGG